MEQSPQVIPATPQPQTSYALAASAAVRQKYRQRRMQENLQEENESHAEDLVQLCLGLSYRDKQECRLNITENKTSVEYSFNEDRSIRMTVKAPPQPPNTDGTPSKEPFIPMHFIAHCFHGGSLDEYRQSVQGILNIGFNVYKIVLRTVQMKNKIIEAVGDCEITGRGVEDDEIFQMQIADFKDPIRSLTFFPIPAELSDADVKDIVENTLKIGVMENCSWGTHRNTQFRNGFVHVRVRTPLAEVALPDRMYINERSITILKEGEKLFRPCPLCTQRNHEVRKCPSFSHFANFALEKKEYELAQIETQKERDALYAKEVANKEAELARQQREREEQARTLTNNEVNDIIQNGRDAASSALGVVPDADEEADYQLYERDTDVDTDGDNSAEDSGGADSEEEPTDEFDTTMQLANRTSSPHDITKKILLPPILVKNPAIMREELIRDQRGNLRSLRRTGKVTLPAGTAQASGEAQSRIKRKAAKAAADRDGKKKKGTKKSTLSPQNMVNSMKNTLGLGSGTSSKAGAKNDNLPG